MSKSLVFKGNEITPFDNGDGRIWFKSKHMAELLEYADEKSVNRLYNRNKDEFSQDMTLVVTVTSRNKNNVIQHNRTRIFSSRGAHLLGMLADTKIAKALRKWLLDLADKESKMPVIVSGYTIRQLQDIISQARKVSDDDSSDAGFRLRKRRDDLPMLEKAEAFIKGLGQIGFELVGGGK